uniref:VWA domain-containing protein n=1 Tax=Meiothermus sp. TaxID=1955249 RepID=UPI00307E5FFF
MGKKLARGLLGLLALSGGVASAEATNPAQYVFLVDTSTSMIGREDGRTVIFPQVQRALMRFAEQVVGEAEIRIVPFSQEPQGVARFVLPREREEMLRYIRNLRAEGSSSFIYRSVNKSYDELCSEPRAFYLFTDGLDNSAEPAKMPEPKSPCPLTLVVLGKLPQDFADSWKGFRRNHLAEPPIGPSLQTTPTPPDPQVDRQATTETPGVPVAPANPTPKTGIVQAGVQKEYGEEPSPPPAPTSKPTNPGARPTPPQPRATPPSPQPPPTTPASPQPQLRPGPPATAPSIKPQTSPSAA